MDVTEIACHMQKGCHRLDRWGVRVARVNKSGEYIVQQVSTHPIYKQDLVSLNLSFHKTEVEARKAANVEWVEQRDMLNR